MPDSAPQTPAWTVARVLAWTAGDFLKRGIETARLEAELLLARVLGVERLRLIIEPERPLTATELGAYRELVGRRRELEPLAYILGEREFYGHRFKVDRRVLVPRPDTETLVEVALGRAPAGAPSCRALDLCTGSGCVAVSLAKARPTWEVWASDLSAAALELARENALRLGCPPTMRFVESDLFGAIPADAAFDVITANPPYIPSTEIDGLMRDVRDYEPRLALDGGPDGLALLARLITEARPLLAPGGLLAVEVGAGQAPAVRALFHAENYVDVRASKDYGGVERVVSGLRDEPCVRPADEPAEWGDPPPGRPDDGAGFSE